MNGMAQKNKKFRVGLWGLGRHAIKNILPALNKVEEIELIGLYSRNKEITESNSKEFSCIAWKTEQEMLGNTSLDAIYLSTPSGLHYQQGLEVLKAGKHLWSEKPLTMNFEDAKNLISLANSSGLSVSEAFMYFYHPQYQEIKKLVREKNFGVLRLLSIDFGLPIFELNGFRGNKKLGASCLYDVGSYPLSFVLDLFEVNKLDIISSFKKYNKTSLIDEEGRCELLINKDMRCQIEWSYNMSYRNSIDLWGDKGSLYSDKIFSKDIRYSPKIELRDQQGKIVSIPIQSSNPFELMIKSFLRNATSRSHSNKEQNRILELSELLESVDKLENKNN